MMTSWESKIFVPRYTWICDWRAIRDPELSKNNPSGGAQWTEETSSKQRD